MVYPVTDQTRLACQVTGMGTNVIAIEASIDGTNADTVLTFAADKKIHTIPGFPGIAYRGTVATWVSGNPIVRCTVSGGGQITVLQ